MRRAGVGVALLMVGLTTVACGRLSGDPPWSFSSESDATFVAGDAVACHELGGGWVHVRFERDGAAGWRTQHGLPTADGTPPPELDDDELAEAARLRDQRGWDEPQLLRLMEPTPPPEVEARLQQMPSCLAQLQQPAPPAG